MYYAHNLHNLGSTAKTGVYISGFVWFFQIIPGRGSSLWLIPRDVGYNPKDSYGHLLVISGY